MFGVDRDRTFTMTVQPERVKRTHCIIIHIYMQV